MKTQSTTFLEAAEVGYKATQEQASEQLRQVSWYHHQQVMQMEQNQMQKNLRIEQQLPEQRNINLEMQRQLMESSQAHKLLVEEIRALKTKHEVPLGAPESAAESRPFMDSFSYGTDASIFRPVSRVPRTVLYQWICHWGSPVGVKDKGQAAGPSNPVETTQKARCGWGSK